MGALSFWNVSRIHSAGRLKVSEFQVSGVLGAVDSLMGYILDL